MDKPSERRLVENEMIFRQLNDEAKDFILKDAQGTDFARRPLRFYCECSNLECKERIMLMANEYDQIHKNRKQFILKPGHNNPAIEKVVREEPDFIVIEKHDVPPSPSAIDPKIFL